MSTKENYKIIISGPVGAGKTTAIAALSDISPVKTDTAPTDEVLSLKDSTTVAMDYGTIDLGGNSKIHLYGTPGQERFDFMWDIMLEGTLGLILLMNNTRPDPLKDLDTFLSAFSKALDTMPFCVGITHMDESCSTHIDAYRQILSEKGHMVPVFSVDGRSKEDMNILLMAMLGQIEPQMVIQATS